MTGSGRSRGMGYHFRGSLPSLGTPVHGSCALLGSLSSLLNLPPLAVGRSLASQAAPGRSMPRCGRCASQKGERKFS